MTRISARVDPDAVLAQLNQLSVEPFRELLAHYLQCKPTLEALQTFADRYPDRFAQGLTMLSRMSGYRQDTPIVQNNMFVVIQGMSDSQLHSRLEELDKARHALLDRTIDVTPQKQRDGDGDTSPETSHTQDGSGDAQGHRAQ